MSRNWSVETVYSRCYLFEVDWEQMRFWIDNANAALLPAWIMRANFGGVRVCGEL